MRRIYWAVKYWLVWRPLMLGTSWRWLLLQQGLRFRWALFVYAGAWEAAERSLGLPYPRGGRKLNRGLPLPLTRAGWRDLLAPPSYTGREWYGRWARLRAVWCRLRGHPPGVVFYSSHSSEPDWRCKGCGDDLG